jgi:predicted metal-dependent peptidase
MTPLENKIAKAKVQLIQTQPFFASLLLSMPMLANESIETMQVDGDKIEFNTAFAESLSLPETVFLLAHETMHCVFQHMHNLNGRDAEKWSIAGDYLINELLTIENIGAMPKGGLFNSELVKRGGNTTQGIYDLIPDSDKGKKLGSNGAPLDNVKAPGNGDPAKVSESEAKMKVKVIQAANAAKMQGKLSAGIARLVAENTRTKTDWKANLRRFFSEKCKTDWSYAKPKRRFLADDISLPGLTGEKLGSIVIAVDCSGSVNEKLLNSFGAEIRAILEDCQPAQTHVIYFDSKVLKTDTYAVDDSVSLKPIGGGGTAFSPIWAAIEAQDINCTACVVLTDLVCYDFGDCPAYPVLWASTARDSAPFGEVLKIEEN